MSRRGGRRRQEEGHAGPHPDRARRDHGLLQPRRRQERAQARRPDVADIFLGKITKWNDPAIAAEPGRRACPTRTSRSSTAPTSRARRRTSRVPGRLQPGVEERSRRRQDRQVADGHRSQGQRRRRRCVKQTDGAIGYVEQAYALQNNFTTADVKNKSGKFVAPTLDSTSAAGDGHQGPGRPALQRRSTRRAQPPTRSRRRRSCSSTRTCARRA